MSSPISGPIPAYSNPPIQPQFYSPRQQFISNITLGITTTVTMTTDTLYSIGQVCRLLIPKASGCRQLNYAIGQVLSIPSSNQVNLSIDSSRGVDPFVTSLNPNQPQIIPIGDVNTGAANSNGNLQTSTILPGSFIDISPL